MSSLSATEETKRWRLKGEEEEEEEEVWSTESAPVIKLEKRNPTVGKKNCRDQKRRNKILSFFIGFPQILQKLPRERQIRDMKSAISCGGFHPKCLKRV